MQIETFCFFKDRKSSASVATVDRKNIVTRIVCLLETFVSNILERDGDLIRRIVAREFLRGRNAPYANERVTKMIR